MSDENADAQALPPCVVPILEANERLRMRVAELERQVAEWRDDSAAGMWMKRATDAERENAQLRKTLDEL